MSDLVDRQAAIDEIARWIGYIDEDMISRIQTGLKRVPTAQPERKKGKWITKIRHEHYPSGKEYEADYCSLCGRRGSLEFDFCPNCGAEMEVGE